MDRAEDAVGRTYDRCFSDAAIKIGAGVILGSMFSLLFFKRRGWPIVLTTGFAIGMSYENCERDLIKLLSAEECPKSTAASSKARSRQLPE